MANPSSQREVVWLRLDGLSERSRRELDRIVRAAIDLADREGLEELSMRRLAVELGTGTTTLYRHVAGRDELLDLMIDAAYGSAGLELPATPMGWRDGLRFVAVATRTVLLAHPWLASQYATRSPVGPNAVRGAELVSALALELADDPTTAAEVTSTLLSYVQGAVGAELAEAAEQRRTGLTEQEWRATVAPWVRSVVSDGRYPAFARIVVAADDLTFDERFAFGLERVLDGLAGLGRRRRRRAPRPDGT